MINLITSLKKSELVFFLLAVVLNGLLILFLYKNVFSLEIQGDTWQYAYNQEFAYGNSLTTADSIRSLKTSLGGSYLIFSLIKLTFGLNSFAFYTISVILKFLTVISAYVFIRKLTQNRVSALIASLFLSASFVGIEATHWVFNMYAYVGLIFIILGLSVSLDLPLKFNVKKWLFSFLLIAIGIWVGPMRTNGIMLVVLAWGLYKVFLLRSADSRKNFFYWLGGFLILYLVYRNYLGLFEPAYSQYILDQWWGMFHQYISISKYDFLISPVANAGRIIVPDIWLSSVNFYKAFSPLFGLTNFRAITVPIFLIFVSISWFIASFTTSRIKVFKLNLLLGILWTGLVTFIYKQGLQNFPSWEELLFSLLGGYILCWCASYLFGIGGKYSYLKDIFLFSFFWFFSFMLVPIVLNGGNTFSTLHRYFVVTAIAFPLFLAGLLTLVLSSKNFFYKSIVLILTFMAIILHSGYTKSFFDNKAQTHSRVISQRIWDDFVNIVPNKPEYKRKNPRIWFEAKSSLDRETLFESLLFGGAFRIGMKYGWDAANTNGFYFENYETLISDVRKSPDILDEFYAIRVQNRRLIDITDQVKKDILGKI